jgi:mono/diheme cytochrome c family protein
MALRPRLRISDALNRPAAGNPASNCPTIANGATLIDPVAEYGHELGVSVTGGYVYRGSAIPALVGRYVFGDFVGGQDWIYPSEAQCLQCHTAAAGRSLGLEARQLNTSITYPATGRNANQLETLEAIGMFTASPARPTAMPDPADTSKSLADRARVYLHTNCSHCHRPSGGTPADLDLQYTTAIEASGFRLPLSAYPVILHASLRGHLSPGSSECRS